MTKAVELKKRHQKDAVAMRKAIRKHCLDCMCDQRIDCEIPDCPLYPYKPFGKPKVVLKKAKKKRITSK